MTETPIEYLSVEETDEHALSIRYADIESINFLPDNIKAHDVEGIAASIQRYGFVDPILINQNTARDLDGNGTLKALLLLNARRETAPKGIVVRKTVIPNPDDPKRSKKIEKWFVPVVDGVALSEMDELTLAIGINRLSEKGGIDTTKAFEVLKRLHDQHPEEFVKTNYDPAALENIQRLHRFAQKLKENAEMVENRTPEQKQAESEADLNFAAELNKTWNVTAGDLWSIGSHRLLCGDSTSDKSVEKLWGDQVPRLVFTSPPYDQQRNYHTGEFNWTELMVNACYQIFSRVAEPFDMIVNLGIQYKDSKYQAYWNDWLDWCSDQGNALFGMYVWDKGFGYPGDYHGRLSTAHEYLFHFSTGHVSANKWIETTGRSIQTGPTNFSKRKASGILKPGYDSPDTVGQAFKIPDSVIRMYNEQSRGIHTKGHPAIFPVSLPEFMMQTWSKFGDTVYEPFAGSGSTIIAAENFSRKCLAMEISPDYCALILERIKRAFPEMEIKKI